MAWGRCPSSFVRRDMDIALGLLLSISSWQFIMYIFCKAWIPSRTREIRAELWWSTAHIAGPIALLDQWHHAITTDSARGWWIISAAINVFMWWFWIVHDKDKDDRWKKRRKKAAEKVKQVAGRLVVVPVPNPT